MDAITLTQKKTLLAAYYTAETKVLEGYQSWTVDGVTYSKANLYHLQRERRKLEAEINAAENANVMMHSNIRFPGRY